jgi:hypothetical protein
VTRRGTPLLAAICRHPIKSIGYEDLVETILHPAHPLPGDRAWAVAHADANVGWPRTGWAPKSQFLRGVVAAELMAIRAETLGPDTRIALHHPAAGSLEINLEDEADALRLVAWLGPMWPDGKAQAARLVRAESALADNPEPFVAILGMASLRALSEHAGQELSIHRFRGNLWVEGWAPWEEASLIGREIAIGETRLVVRDHITRCKATTANPQTGRFDADTLGALERACGSRDFGVFAEVVTGGPITVGMTVAIR